MHSAACPVGETWWRPLAPPPESPRSPLLIPRLGPRRPVHAHSTEIPSTYGSPATSCPRDHPIYRKWSKSPGNPTLAGLHTPHPGSAPRGLPASPPDFPSTCHHRGAGGLFPCPHRLVHRTQHVLPSRCFAPCADGQNLTSSTRTRRGVQTLQRPLYTLTGCCPRASHLQRGRWAPHGDPAGHAVRWEEQPLTDSVRLGGLVSEAAEPGQAAATHYGHVPPPRASLCARSWN